MDDLQILLLGTPEIRWKGAPLPIQRRVTRALLFYLAAQGGMVARNELLLFLWQDHPLPQARKHLRETLSRLRQVLPNPDLILTTNDLVGLNFERVFVDQREFDRLIATFGQLPWKIPVCDPLPTDVLQQLVAAARLWRGPRYLAGTDMPSSYEMDNWLTLTSQRYEQLYHQLFGRLSCHFETQGDWEQAIRYAERVIENDHLNESWHIRILNLLIAAGNIEQARNYYAQVEILFTQELGAPPSEQFKDVLARLRLSQPSRQPFRLPESLQLRPIMDAPFVGRQQMLAQLWQSYQKRMSIFLSGEIGIGKTRLLQEFFQRQQISSQLIASRCTPGGEESPFQSTLDAEREYGHIREHFLQIPAIYARQILRLVPELAEIRPELLDEDDTPTMSEQQLTLEAARQFLLAITKTHNILFVIEDIQWMDSFTLSAIDYVIMRYPFGSKAMLILTGRADECPPATLKTIHTWMAAGYMSQIEVGRLNSGDIDNLASAVLPSQPSAEFIAQLAADTGGNPCYILEILRHVLQQTSNLDVSKALPLPLSTQLSVIIHNRIEALTPPARQVFDAAAIIGAEFSPEVVQWSLSMDRVTFEHALGELEARGLIINMPNMVDTCYRFTHEKFREILLADLKPLQARLLHQKAAEALVALDGERVSHLMLAYHNEKAGDLVKAFENWMHAAQNALRLHQFVDATRFFGQAESLIEPAGNLISPEALYRLYRSWQDATLAIFDTTAYEQICQRQLAWGYQRTSSLLVGAALNGLTRLAIQKYQYIQGLNLSTQALPYVEQSSERSEYMEAHALRGALLYMGKRLNDALQMFQRALVIGEMDDTPPFAITRARAFTHEHIAIAYHVCGWMDRSLQHAQHALSDAILTQDFYHQALTYFALAQTRLYRGEFAQAFMDTDFGLRVSEQIGSDRMVGYHYLARAMVELETGDLSASLHHTAQAYVIAEKHQLPGMFSLVDRNYGDFYMRLDQSAQALHHYQLGQAACRGTFLEIDFMRRIGWAYALLGNIELASRTLDDCVNLASQAGADLYRIEAQIAQAYLMIRQGLCEPAHQFLDDLQVEIEQRELVTLQIIVDLLLGEITRQKEQFEFARQQYDTIAERSALLNSPWQEFRARFLIIQMLDALDLPAKAHYQRSTFLLDQLSQSIHENDRLPGGEVLKDVFLAYRQKVSREGLRK